MTFEVYVEKTLIVTCATLREAQAHARAVVKNCADAEVEILNPATKRAVEPAASQRWRDELAAKLG